jgi:hypothetical protein
MHTICSAILVQLSAKQGIIPLVSKFYYFFSRFFGEVGNKKYTTLKIYIRLIEGNAKCGHLKKLTCKWTLQQMFICLGPRSQNPIPPPPPNTLYTCILIHTGKGRRGGELNQREEDFWIKTSGNL